MNPDPERPSYKIGEVNCASKFGQRICQDLNVEKTPTLLLFPASEEPILCTFTGNKFMQGSVEMFMKEGWQSSDQCVHVPDTLLPKKSKSKSNKKDKKEKKKKKQKDALKEKKKRREEKQRQKKE